MSQDKVILELRKLKKYFPLKKNVNLKAVEDVTFKIYEGEKFGVVGESGCGKSTLGRVILQLYKQTSGSCVYYGKTIEEVNPKYIAKEIAKLVKYQQEADKYYKQALEVDKKIEACYAQRDAYDVDGSKSDIKKYDNLSLKIGKLEFESKELKKNASRQLREGSRTVGSLILCKDLPKIAELFAKAQKEVDQAHEYLSKCHELEAKYEKNNTIMYQIRTTSEEIDRLNALPELSEEEALALSDLKAIRSENSKVNVKAMVEENLDLKGKMIDLYNTSEEHRMQAMKYKEAAFEYRGKDILPITERCLDPEYQKKLDGNYEEGINLSKLDKKEMRELRRDMQMIFQDPAASLDPRQSIGSAIEEVYKINTKFGSNVRREKAMELLEKVGLKREHYYSYPHALSGGQKQRVGIARAIALDTRFVVLDEAVSALDVSVQAQILQLLNQLSEENHLTYFFITHDLGVVKHFCDRILVMYLGNVCELSESKKLFKKPLHPYTQSLLASVPRLTIGAERGNEQILEGEVPSAINPPKGCPFHTRCPKCMEICKQEKPRYIEAEPNHFVACHLYDEVKENEL